MKDETEQLLKNLHLRCIAELFEEESKRADKQKLTYEDFVVRLLRAQWQRNQEMALSYRIKQARLPEQWSLETFPFKRFDALQNRPGSALQNRPTHVGDCDRRQGLIAVSLLRVHHASRTDHCSRTDCSCAAVAPMTLGARQ